jgi:hypothetical protein
MHRLIQHIRHPLVEALAISSRPHGNGENHQSQGCPSCPVRLLLIKNQQLLRPLLERRVHQVGRDNLALAQALGQFQ